VQNEVWDMSDAAELIAAQEVPVGKRGPYKKKAACTFTILWEFI
jgi:hypothetical protein